MHRIINLINLLIDHVDIVTVLTEQLGIVLRAITYETLSFYVLKLICRMIDKADVCIVIALYSSFLTKFV